MAFWGTLSDAERKLLLEDIASIDFALLTESFRRAKEALQGAAKLDDKIQPLPRECQASVLDAAQGAAVAAWEKLGLELIGAGQVAVLLLAGGQGTRLGVKHPKVRCM